MNFHPLLASALLALPASAVQRVTEILDASGDGMGNMLGGPHGVTDSASGNIYVTSFVPDAVYRVARDGSVQRELYPSGDGMGASAELPHSAASSGSGDVYVTCVGSDNAFQIKPSGRVVEILTAVGSGPGQALNYPLGVHIDRAGNVLVAGAFSDNVFRIVPDGGVTEIIDSSGDGHGNLLNSPSGITSDQNGNTYVAGGNSLFRVDVTGGISAVLDSTGDGLGHPLFSAYDVAIDSSGNLFVASRGNDLVFKVTQAGVVSVVLDATGDGQTPVCEPCYLAVDSADNLYVVSRGNDTVFRVTPSGAVTKVLDETGNGTGTSVLFMTDIAVDTAGSVYVTALTSNNAVKLCSEFAIGSNYCSTSPNSVGAGATIAATGDESVSSRCLTLRASSAPDDTPGIFYFGTTSLAGTPFGEGLRCVGGTTIRVFPFVRTGPSNGNPAGATSLDLDFDRPYGLALSSSPQTTFFQFWYRDVAGGPSGFNLSDAIRIDLQP